MMTKKNMLNEKCFEFSLLVINTHEELVEKGLNYKLYKKFLLSGTNIGASVRGSETLKKKTEKIKHLRIAVKHALESKKTINDVFKKEDYIDKALYEKLITQVEFLKNLLEEIIKADGYDE